VALVRVTKDYLTTTKTLAHALAVAVVLRKPRQMAFWHLVQVLVLLVARARAAIHRVQAVAVV
jgi:hypothetical protein